MGKQRPQCRPAFERAIAKRAVVNHREVVAISTVGFDSIMVPPDNRHHADDPLPPPESKGSK